MRRPTRQTALFPLPSLAPKAHFLLLTKRGGRPSFLAYAKKIEKTPFAVQRKKIVESVADAMLLPAPKSRTK